MTCATDAGTGQQRKGGVNARQGHQGNGFKDQGGLAGVGGFIGRHKRASIAVGATLLLAGPLVTGDGELVFLNAVGLGLGALLLRRFARPQRQAADGTGATGTTATGDEGRNRRDRRHEQH